MVLLITMAQLKKIATPPRISYTFLCNRQTMTKTSRGCLYFLALKVQLFWFAQVIFAFMTVQLPMPARKQIVVNRYYQWKAISASYAFTQFLKLNFSKAFNALKSTYPTSSLLVMSTSPYLTVAVNQHRVPVASRNSLYGHLQRNHLWNSKILCWNYPKPMVFDCSPTKHWPFFCQC